MSCFNGFTVQLPRVLISDKSLRIESKFGGEIHVQKESARASSSSNESSLSQTLRRFVFVVFRRIFQATYFIDWIDNIIIDQITSVYLVYASISSTRRISVRTRSTSFVQPFFTKRPKKKKKEKEIAGWSINNFYQSPWLTNKLPSRPSKLSVPYIIDVGRTNGCPSRVPRPRSPIIRRYLSGGLLGRDAFTKSSLTFSFAAAVTCLRPGGFRRRVGYTKRH